MTRQNVEDELFQLATAWPVPSAAEAVMARVENLPVGAVGHRRPRGWQAALIAAAAALLLALVPAWFLVFGTPRTLQAQVQQAIANAGTAHLTISGLDAEGVRRKGEIWYSHDHGFRAESADEIIVDDRKQQWLWRPGAEATDLVVIRRASRDAMSMIAETFQLGNAPTDWGRERSVVHDREINGRTCRGFIVTPATGNSSRIVVLVDAEQRIVRMEEQRQVSGQWQSGREISIEYDVPVAAERFIANLPPATRIVDADRVLDERFPLERALAKTETDGLLFAVHEVFRGEDGMFFVVSSVRGTPEYLQRNPPKLRHLNWQSTILDVAEQPSAPGSADGLSHRATLASAEEGGVHYLWWLAVRRQYFSVERGVRTSRGQSPSLEIEPGSIRLPLRAILRGPNHNWVTAVVEVALPADASAKSLLELAARVRRDVLLIRHSGGLMVALHGGIKDNQMRHLEPEQVTDAGYAREWTEQLEWLHSFDELQGRPLFSPERPQQSEPSAKPGRTRDYFRDAKRQGCLLEEGA